MGEEAAELFANASRIVSSREFFDRARFHLLEFVLSADLEIAYNVIPVDSMKNPIRIKAAEASAIFVTI